MKEQFVTYEIALKLKELAFDEECFGYYSEQYDKTQFLCLYQEEDYFDEIRLEAPLWQQVIDWFDEKNIHIIINFPQSISGCIGFISTTEQNMIFIDELGTIWKNRNDFYKSAILKAIELCKKRK